MDWRLYADHSRFVSVPQERLFVLQGHIRKEDGRVYGQFGLQVPSGCGR
jgi:hypothetical protein